MFMSRRNGTTLVEVLVAIFIMAIGLLTLLTLFPLGALSMAQAIKDDRTAHAAASGAAIAEACNIRNDPLVLQAFTNPGIVPPAQQDGSSYPVFVDPIAVEVLNINRLAAFPRVSLSFISGQQTRTDRIRYANKWFTLLDDMNFYKDGNGVGTPVIDGQSIEREGRYSWAYLLKRPRLRDSVADLTVVVFSGRPAIAPLAESQFGSIAFNTTSNVVVLPYPAGNKPSIRKGSWIMDATYQRPQRNGSVIQMVPEPHGYFYRVVGVSDGATNTLVLELQSNPRVSTVGATVTDPGYGILLFMEHVVEVFDKNAGRVP
jgi:hypothetical protein